MNGDGKSKNHKNSGFYNGLCGLKSKRCPWRRVGGLVVDVVKKLENSGVMHTPMSPIKIGVMHQKE
jgi:hypothetical protein